MRQNLPVTGKEYVLQDGVILASRTDTKGVIAWANDAFVQVSGFAANELIGQPHNIVRHPDMPPATFADLWATLKAGRPWVGIVKNRRKDGDHYWEEAQVTPIMEDGRTTGYLSVRRPASRAQIDAAERAYALFRAGNQGRLRLRFGAVETPSLGELNPLWRLSLYSRLMLMGLGIAIMAAVLIVLARSDTASHLPWYLAGAGALFFLYSCHWLGRDLSTRLDEAMHQFRRIASNDFAGRIDISRADEVGKVLLGLKSMQIRLGYSVLAERRRADEATRIRQALDVASTGVMVTDNDFCVLYVNDALGQMMRAAEPDFRRQHPAFRADALLGCGIDQLFGDPAQQRKRLAELRQPLKSVEEIGGRSMELVITPVTGENGQRLGYVVEWKDRTAELAIEREIAQVVRAAADGDFSQRIGLEGKQGFVRVLSEGVDHLLEAADLALAELQQVLAALANGDLTRSIRVEFAGRFGEMSENANRTVAQLGAMIRQIQQSAGAIATAASEIASGNADLSARTEQQAANVEETASSMEELTATVKQNAANSQAARQLAAGAAEVANRGGQVVGQVVETMAGIHADSQRIAEIITVIDGIAFQTNILALNAAVEAARAGEQGRGFAVVASEVRALAQRSASAAKEIRALIDESVGRVESGTGLVEQAGKTIAEVVSAVHKVSDLVAEIAAASQEQSGGIEQVNHTIAHIDEATQQNAALVEEATAAARTLEQEAAGLTRTVANFRLSRQ